MAGEKLPGLLGPPGLVAELHHHTDRPARSPGAAEPWPRYGAQALSSWVLRAGEAWPDSADVFVYFNNDQHAAALYDAATFASIARRAGRRVTPVLDLET